ncbi:MAG: hypothetical protein KatS3mg111_2691 [Pirellulaceae bacterium]|nr:MAG: hypothetical protein KatS3mg111_2691 [Pirellulaceae bacterium]
MVWPSRTYGKRRSTGISLRILLAAIIAIVSFVSYYSMTDQNPVTGEAQRVALTPEQEIALGLQAAPEMAAQFGGLHPDREGQARVDRIGAALVDALNAIAGENSGENPFSFEFHLLRDDSTINAFALPGGQIFITAGLYRRLTSDAQLAGVLGHEIGHVLMRHGAQRLAKLKLTQGLVGAAGVAGGSTETAHMAAAIGQLINMKYGRDDELESDKWGVRLMARAGYDPRAMLDVMRILEEAAGGDGPPEMLSTHPKPANRQSYIQQVIAEEFPDGIPPGLLSHCSPLTCPTEPGVETSPNEAMYSTCCLSFEVAGAGDRLCVVRFRSEHLFS